MKVQRVYIDTSVVGGCHDEKFAPWSNVLMEDFRRGRFRPVVSDVIDADIQDAPSEVRHTYFDLLDLEHRFVETTEEAEHLANTYLKREILTPNYYDDALHIALSTVEEVDVLTSWNFKHIVHFDKIRRFNAVNLELGYKQIEIRTPQEVTSYGKED
ncbi:MAG: hypothetical protein V5A20_13015 [Salinibacter sp.]|uniref:hypothetical protein n=1 Tax=Salinibacter sp. TaxID=2065818 RepID=UPI002FC34F54